MGFVQHMLKECLAFIKQFRFAGTHPGTFSTGQKKQRISVASFHGLPPQSMKKRQFSAELNCPDGRLKTLTLPRGIPHFPSVM
jgi:hypothetical protein